MFKLKKTKPSHAVLVVCMGNICRSPSAEAVLRKKFAEAGMNIHLDSAGTIGSHRGERPDPRSVKAGEARGYSFKGIRSRKVVEQDFEDFDYVLAADRSNVESLKAKCPEHLQHKIHLMMEFAGLERAEIPDPYYGSKRGFDEVLDLIEQASEQIIKKLRN